MKPPLTAAEIDDLAICHAHSALDEGFASCEQNLADLMHEHGVSWDRAAMAMDLMAKEFDRIAPR